MGVAVVFSSRGACPALGLARRVPGLGSRGSASRRCGFWYLFMLSFYLGFGRRARRAGGPSGGGGSWVRFFFFIRGAPQRPWRAQRASGCWSAAAQRPQRAQRASVTRSAATPSAPSGRVFPAPQPRWCSPAALASTAGQRVWAGCSPAPPAGAAGQRDQERGRSQRPQRASIPSAPTEVVFSSDLGEHSGPARARTAHFFLFSAFCLWPAPPPSAPAQREQAPVCSSTPSERGTTAVCGGRDVRI